MPKLKTKKAAAKRFKITGTGKLKRNKSNTQHNCKATNKVIIKSVQIAIDHAIVITFIRIIPV